MMLIRRFSHEVRSLEIRAAVLPDGWAIQLYEGDRQASPIKYNITHQTALNITAKELPVDLVKNLMELMEHEVKTGHLRLLPPETN